MDDLADAHLLIAKLHRSALLRLASSSGKHSQGLSMAARSMGMSSSWKRTSREMDADLGISEKITEASCVKWLQE